MFLFRTQFDVLKKRMKPSCVAKRIGSLIVVSPNEKLETDGSQVESAAWPWRVDRHGARPYLNQSDCNLTATKMSPLGGAVRPTSDRSWRSMSFSRASLVGSPFSLSLPRALRSADRLFSSHFLPARGLVWWHRTRQSQRAAKTLLPTNAPRDEGIDPRLARYKSPLWWFFRLVHQRQQTELHDSCIPTIEPVHGRAYKSCCCCRFW